MGKPKWIKIFRKFHKWPGIIIAFFAIIFALSGLILNHRDIVSAVDIPRKYLPSNYLYQNWNLASVRGSLNISGDTGLIFGNIGIWKSTDNFRTFSGNNMGFPKGIDGRKINSVIKFKDNWLVAATQFGLFIQKQNGSEWVKVKTGVQNERIVDLVVKEDSLIVLTRDVVLKSVDLENFSTIQLPPPLNYKRKTGMFNLFWELHSGELFGKVGKLVVDLLGLVVIILSLTGLLHFLFPKIIRRLRTKEKPVNGLVVFRSKNLRWHNVIGYLFALFLVINTFSGMHLRPPFLIAIADKQVGIIPFSHLDSPNPWQNKLRRIYWDSSLKKYILSTSDGFYFADESFTLELIPFASQPPVSVMGCNVFEEISKGKYLVGSFSGMFIWDIYSQQSVDFFSGQLYNQPQGMARPIASNMVAGLVHPNKKPLIWFDYNRGAVGLDSEAPDLPQMPEEINRNSPISLWNVALEVHTGRIFEKYIGSLYILYVPLAGLCILVVLFSGFLLWWFGFRKKKINGR